ncbi:JmjC domain-containing protein [Pseudomonas lini]
MLNTFPLLGNVDIDTFSTKYWGKRFAIFKQAMEYSPFSIEEFKDVLMTGAPYRCEGVRISHAESASADNRRSLILAKEPAEAAQAIRDGNSITINHLERFLSKDHPLNAIYRELCRLIGTSASGVQIAAFYTPSEGRAFGRHRDRNHIFSLQICGEKNWVITDSDGSESSFCLTPGDTLYLPYGIPHAVKGGIVESLSLTFILRTPMWRDLAIEVILNRLDNFSHPLISSPGALPFGWIEELTNNNRDSQIEKLCENLMELGIDASEWIQAAQRMAMQAFPNMPINSDPFRTNDQITLTLSTNLLTTWQKPLIRMDFLERVLLGAPGKPQVDGTSRLSPALDFIISRQTTFTAADLPDIYQNASKLEICQRLLQASYLRVTTDFNEDKTGESPHTKGDKK